MVQALYMGGTLATIVAMLLLLNFLDDPVRSGVGGLQPDGDGAGAGDHGRVARRDRRRGRPSRATTTDARSRERTGAAAAAERDWVEIVATVLLVGRRGGHGVEQLPGGPVERRAGQDGEPGERDARRGGASAGPGRGPDRGRRGDVHPVGGRQRARRRRAEGLLRGALPRRVQAGVRGVAGHRSARHGRRAAHAVRDGRVPARGRRARPRSSTREAEVLAAQVRRNIQRSTNYVLGRDAVRGVAVLRRHEHEARGARPRGRRCS